MPFIRSAISLKLRPTAHLTYLKKPASDWSVIDHKIAVAFSRLEAEICDKCGNPIWVCRNEAVDVTFKVKKYRCFADATLEKKREEWEKRNSSRKGAKRLKHGEYEYVVAEPGYGLDRLPTRAEWIASLSNNE